MALKGCVQFVDVGLMVLAVMDLHRLRIDVGLESRVVVGKLRKAVGTCHGNAPFKSCLGRRWHSTRSYPAGRFVYPGWPTPPEGEYQSRPERASGPCSASRWWSMQSRAAGFARSRSSPMSRPHTSQVPSL